jgi:methyl-accepting chemotaxis protein
LSIADRAGNLAIRSKILIAFAAVLLLLVALGGTALHRSSVTNATVEDLTSNYALAIVNLDEMRVNALLHRTRVMRSLLTDDQAVRQSAAGGFATAINGYQENDAKYAESVDPGTEATLYVEVKAAWAAYLAGAAHIQELVDGDKLADAKAYLLSDLIPAGQRSDAAILADMKYNVGMMKTVTAQAETDYSSGRLYIIGFMIIAALVAVVAGTFLVRSIGGPVKAMTAAMRRLAARDLTAEVPALGRTDEVGQMADAVQVFKDGMVSADRMAAEQASERSSKEQRGVRLEKSVASFEVVARGMVELLASGATDLETTARAMTGGADRTNQQASAAAAAAEQAGTGVQTVAAATEELTASIHEISRQVAQSSKMAARAVADAQRTDTIVTALAEAAHKIGSVVSLISDIAGQTNLLALNATIEAARAGDAGKGFAVVASEVKSLASQTGRATDDIGAQIAQIQAATQEAVTAIRGIASSIEEVSTIATSIASAVEEQGSATAEIARNVQQTATAAQDVTVNITGVGQSANDSSAAAAQVLSAAGELSKQAARMSAEVNTFVADVRAA